MITINLSNFQEISNYLKEMNSSFIPELDTRVDIDRYAQKIADNAVRLEYRENDKLIGLLAFYVNIENQYSFITTFSIKPEFQGKGHATELMNKMLSIQNEYPQIDRIELEVNDLNQKAKGFYKNYGFEQIKKSQDILVLSKSVNQVNRN